MAQQNILPGNPPIVWSTVDDAFQRINSNFTELYLSIGGPGVDLTSIASSLIPDTDSVRDLGSTAKRWKDIYLSGSSIYLGTAVITANPLGQVNLPAGSKVGGELIRNPAESSFKTIRISGQDDIVANNFAGVLNIVGNGIGITTVAGTDTVTFTNSGVTSLTSGSGISVNTSTGSITIANSGIIGAAAGSGIGLVNVDGSITISNTGVTQLTAGAGIVLNNSTGSITITNSAPNVPQNVFRYIAVSGDDTLDPGGPTTTLNVNTSGNGFSVTSNALTNTLTFQNTGVTSISGEGGIIVSSSSGDITISIPETLQRNIDGDITGSVFSDSSSMLVDGTNGKIVGPVDTVSLKTADLEIALGDSTGTNQGLRAVAVGALAGSEDQGQRSVSVGNQSGQFRQGGASVAIGPAAAYFEQGGSAVAIGDNAGQTRQGNYAVAIGYYAGHNDQSANSIILNASGAILNGTSAGFYVNPVRSSANGTPMMYNQTSKEIFYSNVLEFIGSTISTSDSSSIIFDSTVDFDATIFANHDIQLSGDNTIRSATKIKLVPTNNVESANVTLSITGDNIVTPRVTIDTPDGVDIQFSSGIAGMFVSKNNGAVSVSAGNNSFIVRQNGSFYLSPLDAAPDTPTIGLYVPNGTSWDPASKATGRPYIVFYDGTSYNSLY